jgi:SAM-dependent MidA family methyltransferase
VRTGRDDPGRYLPWESAWQRALYGPSGFFISGAGPAAHFRTAVHAAAPLLAGALLRLARAHGCDAVVDLGAGRGELLTAIAALPDAAGLRLHGVDVVARPVGLPTAIGWSNGLDALADGALGGALVVAWELLDDVPCPVLEADEAGLPRVVLVDPVSGAERLGPPAADRDLAWCTRWWPLDGAPPGTRAEVGRPRDELWAGLVTRAGADQDGAGEAGGALLAVDYAHDARHRPAGGSLSAFRGGRAVPEVPDGSCDLTAHVALDAVAAAGERAGAVDTRLIDQRTALIELGVALAGERTGGPADPAAPTGGQSLLRRLAVRAQAAELLDPGSLGGFGWLLQRVRR